MSKIEVSATVSQDINKVWKFYNDPEHIIHWNFADPSWHCPEAENDPRTGGKYRARMEARDGSFGFDFEATYLEVQQPKRLVYEMSDGRQSEVNFTENGDATDIHILFDADVEHPLEMQRAGWQAILNNFKKYTEEN